MELIADRAIRHGKKPARENAVVKAPEMVLYSLVGETQLDSLVGEKQLDSMAAEMPLVGMSLICSAHSPA